MHRGVYPCPEAISFPLFQVLYPYLIDAYQVIIVRRLYPFFFSGAYLVIPVQGLIGVMVGPFYPADAAAFCFPSFYRNKNFVSCSMEDINPWTTLQSRKIYENNWIGLTEHDVINPSGGNGIYGVVHFKNIGLGILPLDEQLNTWLVGQYRYSLNAYSWEIPEGGGPLTLPPLESAKRELLEETGLTATDWVEIQRMHLSNSVSNELAIIYIAQGLTIGTAEPEETEALILRKLPFEEAYQMVMDGKITDSMSVAALLKAKILLQEGKL